MHNLLSHLWKWSSENALHRLNNNHGCGEDGIAGEVWKYSAGAMSVILASTFQSGIRGRATFGLRSRDPHSSVETWQATHCHWLFYLELRSHQQLPIYSSQSRFRTQHSTEDIIWCDRWLAAITQIRVNAVVVRLLLADTTLWQTICRRCHLHQH